MGFVLFIAGGCLGYFAGRVVYNWYLEGKLESSTAKLETVIRNIRERVVRDMEDAEAEDRRKREGK